MKLDQLNKVTTRSKKRVGRGIGSGRGKTAGRGTKGQKARGKVPATFSGAGLPLYKKLPYRRGLGNRQVSPKAQIVQLSQLVDLEKGTVITIESLIKAGILPANKAKRPVKILGQAELKVALDVQVPVSKSAQLAIEKAGGKVVQSA